MKKYNRNFVIYSDELGDILAIVLCNNSDYEKIQAWIEQFYKEYEKTRNGEFFIGQLYQLYEDSEAYGLDFELQLCEDTICVYHVEPWYTQIIIAKLKLARGYYDEKTKRKTKAE